MQPSFPLACRSDQDVVAKAPNLLFQREFHDPKHAPYFVVLSEVADYGSTRVYLLLQRVGRVAAERFEKCFVRLSTY